MACPKEIFAEIYQQNLLLEPMCKSQEAKAAFAEYEKALHEVRQIVERNTQMDKCKISNG